VISHLQLGHDVLEIRVSTLWTTPAVLVHVQGAEELNRALLSAVLGRREILPRGVQPAERCGPVANFFAWQDASVHDLLAIVAGALRQYPAYCAGYADGNEHLLDAIHGWPVVAEPGVTLRIQHHDPYFASGVYVIRAGEGNAAANAFYRPGFMDRHHEGFWDRDWIRTPELAAGSLLIFPGYVRRQVTVPLGMGTHVMIAFDCASRSGYRSPERKWVSLPGPE